MSATLEGRDLTKHFGRHLAVDHLSLVFHPGQVTGLLGPNGAGKTTTFYLLVGFLLPDGGEVRVNGEAVTRLPFYRRARMGVHYLPQEPSVFVRSTVEGNLRLALEGTRTRWNGEVDALLGELGLGGLRRRKVSQLSAGERRKVELARALVSRPRFLLLDEPFSGVDPLTVADLSAWVCRLAEQGYGVAICDHNVRDTLRITHRAYLIHHGRLLCAGTPQELAAHPQARLAYLGEKFSL
ncbi:MAG: LPS export ABC transporter ATP-binding protein [Candidatus Bipolaricaulaceae bacterium]